METKLDLFKFKQYESEIILLTVRWYLKYSLSYRNLAEMMGERGLHMAHTTIMRWIHQFGPELDQRIHPYLKPTSDSFRTDETYIKIKGEWKYLYRAVDSRGNIICNCCTRTWIVHSDLLTKDATARRTLKNPHFTGIKILLLGNKDGWVYALT